MSASKQALVALEVASGKRPVWGDSDSVPVGAVQVEGGGRWRWSDGQPQAGCFNLSAQAEIKVVMGDGDGDSGGERGESCDVVNDRGGSKYS